MKQTITLPQIEYKYLKQIKKRYDLLRKFFELQTMEEPSTKSSAKVLREFRKTNLYNEDFIKSLEKGLKESRYFSKSS